MASHGMSRVLTERKAVNRAARFAAVVALLTSCVAVADVPGVGAAARSWPHSVVAGFSTPSGAGYWLVYADGTVKGKGNARPYGDATRFPLVGPIVGGATTPSGKGYWLAASDGGVFTFGDAHFYGSMGGTHLNGPVFSIAPTPTGKGYWLVARDGGVFAFGDAHFYGSAFGGIQRFPIAGFAVGPNGAGYQMITRYAALLNFGKFPLPTSLPGRGFDAGVTNVIGMASTPTKRGEWIALRSGGGALAVGDARYVARPAHSKGPIVGIFSNPKHQGFALVTASGAVFRFGAAPG